MISVNWSISTVPAYPDSHPVPRSRGSISPVWSIKKSKFLVTDSHTYSINSHKLLLSSSLPILAKETNNKLSFNWILTPNDLGLAQYHSILGSPVIGLIFSNLLGRLGSMPSHGGVYVTHKKRGLSRSHWSCWTATVYLCGGKCIS